MTLFVVTVERGGGLREREQRAYFKSKNKPRAGNHICRLSIENAECVSESHTHYIARACGGLGKRHTGIDFQSPIHAV